MNINYLFSCFCPFLEREHSIHISYATVNMTGDMNRHYKKMGYKCEYFSECPYPEKDEFKRCPVFINAPDEPN